MDEEIAEAAAESDDEESEPDEGEVLAQMEQVRKLDSQGAQHGVRSSDAIGYACKLSAAAEARPGRKRREVLAQMSQSQEDLQALLRQSPRLRAAAESNPKVRQRDSRTRVPRLSPPSHCAKVVSSALHGVDSPI